MPSETTQVAEQFAYTGAFSIGALIVIGVCMGVIVLLLAWRDGRMTRAWLTPLLAVLRLAAIAVVLWMLAGPSIVKTVRHTRTRSFAVIVDTSGSMGVTDPADEPAAERWAQASSASGGTPTFVILDEAASALAVAASQVTRLAEMSPAQSGDAARDVLAQVRQCVDVAASRLRDAPGADDEFERQRTGLLDELSTSAAENLKAFDSVKSEDHKDQIAAAAATLNELSSRLSQLANSQPVSVDHASPRSNRLEEVAAFLDRAQQGWLGDIAKKARVARYAFDAVAAPIAAADWKSALLKDHAPTSSTTDLSAGLEQVFRDSAGQAVEAVLLVSDGGHNTERDPVKTAAAAASMPIYVLPIGQISPSRDVLLHHVQGPRTAYKEAVVVIDGVVDANGYAGQTLTAELLQGDKVIATQELPVSSDTFVRKLTFNARADQLGRQEYSVRLKPMPDEKVADNNEAKLSVDVIEDKMTILLADALPRWEFRYLKNLFRRDSHVEFDQVLTGSPGEENGGRVISMPALPRDLEAWGKYRVVILGDLSPSELNAQQQDLLERYVSERNGTLILIAGDDSMPAAYAQSKLARVLPVTRQPIPDSSQTAFDLFVTAEGAGNAAVQLTDDPAESERLWREISSQVPLYGLNEYCKPKPQAHTLIGASLRSGGQQQRGNDLAFLSWQYYGGGRVVYIAAPFTYRLRQRHGDKFHYQFWGQLLQWAIARDMAGGSKTVKLATDKTRYSPGDEVQVTVQLMQASGQPLAGAKPRVVAQQDQQSIAGADLAEDASQPGTYRATLKKLPPGQVTLSAAGSQIEELLRDEGWKEPIKTTVAVDPYDSPELRDTRCNLPLLKQIADATHGAVLTPTGVGAAMSTLRLDPQVDESVSRRPLWTRWECLWIFAGCLSVEWTLRKLTGLA